MAKTKAIASKGSKPVFATPDRPIRASLLPALFRCPGFFVHKTLNDGDAGGEAAQTGSLTHLGIQAYHIGKGNLKLGEQAVKAGAKDFPDGIVSDAIKYLGRYAEREKKSPRGIVVRNEWKISFELPPASFDPTGQAIYIQGTIDQVRQLHDGSMFVLDIKTGRMYGKEMVSYYAPQLAAYLYGAWMEYKKPMKAFIGRTQDLARSDLPYWWDMGINEKTALDILKPVQNRIAAIRHAQSKGERIETTAGKHCEWCPLFYPSCATGEEPPPPKEPSKRRELKTVAELLGNL